MSLEKALAGLTASNEVTPTDVAMKMLEPSSALMHTEINDPHVMIALRLTKKYCIDNEDVKSAEALEEIMQGKIEYMVSYKRKRENAIVKMFASLMAMFNQNGQQERKGGLFGNGGK